MANDNKNYVLGTVLLGWAGYYRFKKGQKLLGLLYIFTLGLGSVGWIYDIICAVKDKNKSVSTTGTLISSFNNVAFGPFKSADGVCAFTDDGVICNGKYLKYEDCAKIHIISGATAAIGKGGFAVFTANGQEYKLKYAFDDNIKFSRALEFANNKIREAHDEELPLYSFIGYTGSELLVYENHISISHVRTSTSVLDYAGKLLAGGTNGEKHIDIDDITAVQNKEPTSLVAGFVQIAYGGSVERRGNVVAAINDENAIPYYMERADEMKKLVSYLEKRRKEIKNGNKGGNTIVNNSSNADELAKFKQLYDNGIISEEEYNAKKKALLGL